MLTKQKQFRSRKLLDSAKHQPCIRCQREGETRACHYNGQRQHLYGKGRGIKCSDLATAEFCQKCDLLFSEGQKGNWINEDVRSEEFLHYIMLTNESRANRGDL